MLAITIYQIYPLSSDLRNETFDTPCLNGLGDLDTPSQGTSAEIAPLTAPVRADTSLDSFLNKHTSEDNASYKELMSDEEQRKREIADERFQPSLEYRPQLEAIGCEFGVVALTGNEGFTSSFRV